MSERIADEIERVLVVMGGDLSAPEWARVLGVSVEDVRAAFWRLRSPPHGREVRRKGRGAGPRSMTLAQARQAAAAVAGGATRADLAARYGVTPETVRRAVNWARKANAKLEAA